MPDTSTEGARYQAPQTASAGGTDMWFLSPYLQDSFWSLWKHCLELALQLMEQEEKKGENIYIITYLFQKFQIDKYHFSTQITEILCLPSFEAK